MKALRTIGIKKAVRFVGFECVKQFLHWAVVPQVRAALMRLLGARIGGDTIVHDMTFSNLYHYGFSRLTIGRQCFIGDEVLFDMRGRIILEDHVTLSNRVNIVTHINVGYPGHPLQMAYPTKVERVQIKRGAYVGTGATILPGVTVGVQSVVGAGAVVTKNVPDRTVVAGVPARVLKKVKT